jgi:flavin reductase (DIM6/NTAB) family NADH-FMN oxidoreductase RutF
MSQIDRVQPAAPQAQRLDARGFWKLIGQRATAATVVTAAGSSGPAGFLALSSTHLTWSPPTMMVSIDEKTSALETIRAARHFAINILDEDDRELADMFGGKGDIKGLARFGTASWSSLATGAPVLDRALAAIDCELDELIPRHGAVIAIGRIVTWREKNDGAAPLVFFKGAYSSLISGT